MNILENLLSGCVGISSGGPLKHKEPKNFMCDKHLLELLNFIFLASFSK